MGLVYLPTWIVDFYRFSCSYKYTNPMNPSWLVITTSSGQVSGGVLLLQDKVSSQRSGRIKKWLTVAYDNFDDGFSLEIFKRLEDDNVDTLFTPNLQNRI